MTDRPDTEPDDDGLAPFGPAVDGAQMDFDGRMSYGDYLCLSRILTSQNPLSDAHDEMLFVIQHQTSELWMKQIIHELVEAKARIAGDDLAPAFKMLTRVSRIFEQLTGAWQILRTMTPSEYTEFRSALGRSSGFQSYQYRAIEFLAGNKNVAMLRPHAHVGRIHHWLEQFSRQTSIYDEAIRLLARSGFAIDPEHLARDLGAPYQRNDSVHQAWLAVYRDPRAHWQLYDLAEKLVDFEDHFRRWRFNHVTTVERVIGFRRGTGGTSGVTYLKRMLEVVLFPELWQIRADL